MKDIALHILDIAQNSIRANATEIEIEVLECEKDNLYLIEIRDNGEGMDSETLIKVTDPFFTTRVTRKVGLGISLLKQNAERTGGTLTISSILGKGTQIKSNFAYKHIDRLPLGDIAGVVVMLMQANPEKNISYSHTTDFGMTEISSTEIKKILGDDAFRSYQITKQVKNILQNNLEEIKTS